MLAELTDAAARDTLDTAVSTNSSDINSKQKTGEEWLSWAKNEIKKSKPVFLNNILGYALDRANESGVDIIEEVTALGYKPPSIPDYSKRNCSRIIRIAGYADL